MAAPLHEHPAGDYVLRKLIELIQSGQFWLLPSRFMLFICGGSMRTEEGGKKSLRLQFVEYAKDNIHSEHLLLAESAFEELTTYNGFFFRNLAHLEETISHVVDCVILFTESPGSFAELGYFAGSEIKKKVLVAMPFEHHADGSFINEGIMPIIESESPYRGPALIQINGHIAQDFQSVETKLQKLRNYNKKNKTKMNLEDSDEMSIQLIFYLSCFLVQVCRVLHIDDLKRLLTEVVGLVLETETFDQVIAFACGSGLLVRVGDQMKFLIHSVEVAPFIEIKGVQEGRITATAVEFYSEYFPEILNLVGAESLDLQ